MVKLKLYSQNELTESMLSSYLIWTALGGDWNWSIHLYTQKPNMPTNIINITSLNQSLVMLNNEVWMTIRDWVGKEMLKETFRKRLKQDLNHMFLCKMDFQWKATLMYRVEQKKLSWEKVSARLQPATAGHARLVLSKTVPFFCTTLY